MTSPKIGQYRFVIDAYLSDFRSKATLPMISGYILQSATRHAEERGFGYHNMNGQQRAWVLSRMVIEMYEYPKNDTAFTVNTWVADVNRLFTERYFSFEDATGKEIGYAKTVWACIDLETRRPTNVLELNELVQYIDRDKECPIEGLNKIPLLKDGESDHVGSFIVKYSDIDINKHLNSMKYIEHFVDVFDINLFKEKEIKRFQINYVSEVHYGANIQLFLKNKKEDTHYLIEMIDNDKVACSASIVWG